MFEQLRQGNNQLGYWTTPTRPPRNQQPLALATSVTPEYLDVAGIALLKGRFFNERDTIRTPLVVVVDEMLAQPAFGGDAVGKQLHVQGVGDTTVVGSSATFAIGDSPTTIKRTYGPSCITRLPRFPIRSCRSSPPSPRWRCERRLIPSPRSRPCDVRFAGQPAIRCSTK